MNAQRLLQRFHQGVDTPLPEQHRIVAKVDELTSLCDRLETQLTTTQTDSRRMLGATLSSALAA